MQQRMLGILTVLSLNASVALANVSEGPPDYSGITGLYYVIIGLILAYGVWDTFFTKSS